MPIVIDPKNYVIGPGFVFYRDVGVNTPWTSAGATLDDMVMRVMTRWFSPDNLSGSLGKIKGLDVYRGMDAEIEFTLGEVGGAGLSLAVPGSRLTSAVNADAGGGGSSTTTAAVAAGATTIPFTAVTNFAVGDFFRIEAAAHALVEYRQITAIASLNVSFRDPLRFDHASGVAVVETTGDKRDRVEAPIIRRQPDSAYKEWALMTESGRGWNELRIPIGISQTESIELTVGDEQVTGLKVTIGARYDGADLNKSPFQLYVAA